MRVLSTYQDIIASGIVMVSLIGNVVEIWKLSGQLGLILTLFENILLFVPTPWLIDFSEVLNNQGACFNAFWSTAKDSEAFRVHSEMSLYFVLAHVNSRQYNLGHISVKLGEPWVLFLPYDVFQCFS